MKLDLNSARGFGATLRTLGLEMDVAQLSQGALNGVFHLGGSRQLPVLSIQTNQDLVLHGNRRPGMLPISLNTTDQQPVVRGEETDPGSLHGFHAGLKDTFFLLPSGAHIQVALVSQIRLEQLATTTGDHQVLEVIHGSNSANLHPQRFQEISALIQDQLMGVAQEDLVEVAMLEALTPHELKGTASGELGVGTALMKDLVRWGFENSRQAITLDDLSATIFASRSSIVQHCRQTFGTGPMAWRCSNRSGSLRCNTPWESRTCNTPSAVERCKRLPPITAFKVAITSLGITATNSENPQERHFNGHPIRGLDSSRSRSPRVPRSPWPGGNDRPGRCSQQ